MLTRRSLLAAGGLTALGAAVAGCGNRRYEQARGSVPAQYRDREHVLLWHAYGEVYGEVLGKFAKDFNEAQSDIYVETQFQGTYGETVQKTAAALLARRIPDLVTVVELGWRKFFLDDVLEPLDDYFDDTFTPDVYEPVFLREGVKNGVTWWTPLARSTPLFYFNKSLFRRVGLPERAPTTWDEWAEWMPELDGVEVKGSRVRWEAYQQLDGDWPFQASVWQWGGMLSDGLEIKVTEPPAVEAGEWQRRLVMDGHAYMAASPAEDFGNQLIATLQASAAAAGKIRLTAEDAGWELGAGHLPVKRSRGVPTGGGGLSILAGSTPERKRAAFEFVKYLARPENAATWSAKTGYLPVVPAAQQEPELAMLMRDDPNYASAVSQLKYGRKPDEVWCTVPNANVELATALQRIWTDRQPAERVLTHVANRWDRILDRAGPAIRRHE